MDVLKDILDNLNYSIIITDIHGKITLFNNEASRIKKSISEKPIVIGYPFADHPVAVDAHPDLLVHDRSFPNREYR